MSLRSPPAPSPLIPMGLTLFGCIVAITGMISGTVGLMFVAMFMMAVPWLIYLPLHWRYSRAHPQPKRRGSGSRGSGDSGHWFLGGADSGGWFSGGGDSCGSGDSGGGDSGGGGDCGGGGGGD